MGPPPLLDPPAIVSKAEPAVSGYAAVLRRVIAGETVFTSEIPGEPRGNYRCWLENGTPRFEPVVKASSVVVPPGNHAHTTVDGRTIIHSNANLGSAAAHADIARPWVRTAEAGQVLPCPSGNCPQRR